MNYYVEQIDKAITNHDYNYPLNIKINGTENSSKNFTLPLELLQIMIDWYVKNETKIKEVSI